MKRIISALVAVAVATVVGMAEPLKVGDDAPNFELKGSDGKTYKLSDLRGKTVVVAPSSVPMFARTCRSMTDRVRRPSP